MDNPVVSIVCITYNHEPYIRQCLDGFLMQKTDFPFEVLIHDDASTDRTADIIREYEVKYPHIIKPIYQTENQFSKGVKIGLTYLYPNARGKYIAECEGDDYWTDPLKLQKQVDFLESNPEFVLCTHYRKLYNQSDKKMSFNEELRYIEYDLNSLILGVWLYQPVTILFRKSVLGDSLDRYRITTDVVLIYNLLKKGVGACLPKAMAVYRIHTGGVWSLVSQNEKWLQEFRVRLEICRVENSYNSARFLYNQFAKSISRIWLIKNYKVTMESLFYLFRHLSNKHLLKLVVGKFILNIPLHKI